MRCVFDPRSVRVPPLLPKGYVTLKVLILSRFLGEASAAPKSAVVDWAEFSRRSDGVAYAAVPVGQHRDRHTVRWQGFWDQLIIESSLIGPPPRISRDSSRLYVDLRLSRRRR